MITWTISQGPGCVSSFLWSDRLVCDEPEYIPVIDVGKKPRVQVVSFLFQSYFIGNKASV